MNLGRLFVILLTFLSCNTSNNSIVTNNSALKYSLVNDWPKLPKGFVLGNATGLGMDSSGHLIVFHRADRTWPLIGGMPDQPIAAPTILLFDADNGTLLKNWGAHLFIMPHGLTVDHQDNIWVTDVGLHQVFKFSHEGKLLLTLGEAKVKGNDTTHFNQPTDVAVMKDGSFYVSDGYGNSRIVKFSANGKYLFEWGKKGNGNGEFNIPHAIHLINDTYIYVADRENHLIQVFDTAGKFIKKLGTNNLGKLCAIYFDKTKKELIAVDDDSSLMGLKHNGSNVIIFNTLDQPITEFGKAELNKKGRIAWYHDVVTDSKGNIYVGDILGNTIQKFAQQQ